jgi:hypothetical protein
MNHEDPSVFESIAQASQVRINNFDAQNLANMAWAFAVFDIDPDFVYLCQLAVRSNFAVSRDPYHLFNVEHIYQLHQFQLWCKRTDCWSQLVSG